MLRGIPASGKSTFALNYVKEHPNTTIVCKEEIRYHAFGHRDYKQSDEWKIAAIAEQEIFWAINSHQDVIIADTNLTKEHEIYYRDIARKAEIELEIIEFKISVPEAVARDKERKEPVGRTKIQKMYETLVNNYPHMRVKDV